MSAFFALSGCGPVILAGGDGGSGGSGETSVTTSMCNGVPSVDPCPTTSTIIGTTTDTWSGSTTWTGTDTWTGTTTWTGTDTWTGSTTWTGTDTWTGSTTWTGTDTGTTTWTGTDTGTTTWTGTDTGTTTWTVSSVPCESLGGTCAPPVPDACAVGIWGDPQVITCANPNAQCCLPPPCQFGLDQTCNEWQAMNAFAGHCNPDNTCSCHPGYTLQLDGKCL
ncbi:MAG: hypothetical protein U0441_34270 [Polyangiaceae bacterium]